MVAGRAATRAERAAYVRKLREIERRFGKLERGVIKRSRDMLKNLRNQIAGQIVEVDSWDQFRMNEMTGNLDDLIAGYEGQLRAMSNGAVRDSMSLGRASVMDPLDAAGMGASFFSSSPAQVNVVVDFTADLITDKVLLAHMGGLVDDLGLGMRRQINSQIRMAALGGTSSFQTMRNITNIMGYPSRAKDPAKGVAYEAERILRTETNRAYNLAASSQQRELAKQVPGLQKQWVSTADSRTRGAHLAAHGQIVPVDKPFRVGGENLMEPHDPAGSASNTINCRCRTVTVIPEIGPLVTPVDADIDAEKAKRAKRGDLSYAQRRKLDLDEDRARRAGKATKKPRAVSGVPQNAETLKEAKRNTERMYGLREERNALWITDRLAREGRVSLRVPDSVLDDIFADGGIKNQHETGTSRGALAGDMRQSAENKMFGTAKGLSGDQYPVYGYMRAQGYYEQGVSQYGTARITLKDSVKNRTSMTFGDSLGAGSQGKIVPSPFANPHAGNMAARPELACIDRADSLGRNMNNLRVQYIEAQIHGPITIADIESIDFLVDPGEGVWGLLRENGVSGSLFFGDGD